MKKNTRKLSILLEVSNVPEGVIRELEAKNETYQTSFMEAIQQIMQNKVLNLLAFMELKENLREKLNC